jgi:hypothetical protein
LEQEVYSRVFGQQRNHSIYEEAEPVRFRDRVRVCGRSPRFDDKGLLSGPLWCGRCALGSVVGEDSICAKPTPPDREAVGFQSPETLTADPVPETDAQQRYGVNLADILVLVLDSDDGKLASARLVGTPFADTPGMVKYAGNGVLALFGRFPTLYTTDPKQGQDYPVLFDMTDVGGAIGSKADDEADDTLNYC